MVLTERDRQIVEWVYRVRVTTREHVQRQFWDGAAARSRCQERLTRLFCNRYLDKLPGVASTEPDVYYISRQCTKGLEFLRARHPEENIRPHRIRPSHVAHTLDIAACRIAFSRACRAHGYSLLLWLGEDGLADVVKGRGILPDAYFLLLRNPLEGKNVSGNFLEVERSSKSQAELAAKIRHYAKFYYEGHFEEAEKLGKLKALRVLFLIGDEYGNFNPSAYVEKLVKIAAKVHAPFVWFAPLDQFLQLSAEELPFAPIWRSSLQDGLLPLFPRS